MIGIIDTLPADEEGWSLTYPHDVYAIFKVNNSSQSWISLVFPQMRSPLIVLLLAPMILKFRDYILILIGY